MTPQNEFVVFRCTDCGRTSTSIGSLHAHIESAHYGFGPWNILPHPLRIGNFDADMEKTQVLRVTDYEETNLDEVVVPR